MGDLLMVNETAQELGVAPSTVIHYEKTGKLNAEKTRRGVRLFRREEVERFKVERESRLAVEAAS